MLQAAAVGVRFGKRVILEDVSVDLRPGELVVILGPNGAGKSTLMNVLTGDLAPQAGAARLDGADLARIDAASLAERRAVLPQSSALSFPFTVFEVVRLGVQGIRDNGAVAQRVQAALERVDLDGFGGRFFQQLSGGEQQRVNLARVLAQVWSPVEDGQARYLLLDEPTASLDLKHQLLILDLARAFAAEGGGVGAILHDVNLAALYADRVVVLDKGRVVAEGSPSAVLTPELMQSVFGVSVQQLGSEAQGAVFMAPLGKSRPLSAGAAHP